ncbi:MAG: HEAT repeat domain-containing protein [Polyangiaceae bacterium]|nr:HEAT repeat domain-containing protein [Polyangiaceae bacterium]
MAILLSSAIVMKQAASPLAVESAVARQVLYGGDLVTNLLELGAASEADLSAVVADFHGLPPLPPGELPRADASTIRLLPVEVAHRYALVPVEERDGTLTVAVCEPLDAHTLFQLEDVLGLALTQRVALSVRVRQALWRDYGLPLERRTARLLAKLEGLQDPSPSLVPGTDRIETGSLGPAGPAGLGPSESEFSGSEPPALGAPATEAAATPSGTGATRLSLRSAAGAASLRPRARHIGPYTAANARLDLRTATTRDEVVARFFDFVAQYFEYTALFVVHGDLAEGWDAYGPGTDRSRISAIGVPLDLPSALATAREAGTWQLSYLGAGSLDEALARDLGRHPEGLVFVLPIMLRERCIMLIYGDRGEADVEASQLADVIGIAADVSAALERILMMRKRGALLSLSPAHAESPGALERVVVEYRGVGSQLTAMATALERHPEPARDHPSASDAALSDEPGGGDMPAASPMPFTQASTKLDRATTDGASLALDAASNGAAPPASVVGDSGAEPSERPAADGSGAAVESDGISSETLVRARRRQRRATLRHAALAEALRPARTISIDPPHDDEPDEWPPTDGYLRIDLARPVVTVSGRPRPATPAPPPPAACEPDEPTEAIPLTRRTFSRRSLRAQAAEPTSATGSDASSPSTHDESEPDDRSGAGPSRVGVSDPGSADKGTSHAVSYSPRPPAAARVLPEIRLPSVIVDVGEDCQALADRLLAGDREAAELLVVIGEPAVAVVAGRLPGPVPSGSQTQLGDTRASECGLLLEVLARLGRASGPFVAVRAADADPLVRTWATRLLGELPSPEAVRSVVARLGDKNPEVRQAALAATRMLLAHLDTHDRLLVELDQLAAPTRPKAQRLAGVRALRDLRHAAAVPALLALLSDHDVELAQAALAALVETTRQDFGADTPRWTQWWNNNRTRHRMEWLVDALMHDSPEIRREAGDELKSLTKEYFGYFGDLPAPEREHAQRQYREWWETRGRAKFR